MCSSVFRIKSSSQPTPQRTRYASHPASACSSFASGPTIRPNRGGIKSNVEGRRNIIDVIYSPPTPKVHRPLDLRNLAQHVVCLSLVRNSKIESCTWTPVSDSNDGSCRNQPLRRPSLTIRSSPDFLYVYSPSQKLESLSIYFEVAFAHPQKRRPFSIPDSGPKYP